MKIKRLFPVLGIFVVALVLFFVFAPHGELKSDNSTPAEALITKDYTMERIYTLEALYRVQKGFHEVNVWNLADDVDVKLECRRQISEDCYYYIIQGNGRRCFLFTDSEDNVEEIVATARFLTLDELRQLKNDADSLYPNPVYLSSFSSNSINTVAYSCGSGARGTEYVCILAQDGVLIEESFSLTSGEAPAYYFYTYEERPEADAVWKEKIPSWNCEYQIMQMDLVWDVQ